MKITDILIIIIIWEIVKWCVLKIWYKIID